MCDEVPFKSKSPRTTTPTLPPILQTVPTPLMPALTRYMQTPIHLLHDSHAPWTALPSSNGRQPTQFLALLIFRAYACMLLLPTRYTCPRPTFRTGADGAMDVHWANEGATFSTISRIAGCRLEDEEVVG